MYLKKELYRLIQTDESIFDFIQEGALDGLWYWDLENPENEWMNAKFWKVLGYNPDEMPHKSSAWQNIINQEDLKVANENFSKHCENPNHPYDQVVRYTHKDGSTVWLRCRGMAIRDKDGKPIRMLGAHHDITERRQAEKQLQKAKDDLQVISDNMLDMVAVTDLKGNFTFAGYSHKILGYEIAHLIGKNVMDFVHPDDLPGVQAKFAAFITNQQSTARATYRNRCADGSYLWFETVGTLILDNDGNPKEILFNTRDITERKQAEEALHKINQRLESLLEISQKVTSTIDRDMIMQMIVDNAVKLIGLDTGAIYLKSDDETIRLSATTPELPNNFPDDLRIAYLKHHPHLNKALRTGKHVLMEDALSAKLTSAEKKIVDLRKLRTNLYQPIIIRENPIGVLILSSVETTRVFTSDDLKMLPAFANQAAHIIDNVNNYTSLQKHTHDLKQQIKQREKAEQELTIAKEKAEESDRLKSAFLANMSHEIRTPMNGILGFADLLKEPGLTGDQQQKYIDIIEKSGERMLNIINDIVDISKIEAGLMELDMKESNINEHIEYVDTFFKPEAEAKGIKLSFKNTLPAKEAVIRTDREKVYAILSNLVKNAIKYTHEGSIELGYEIADTHGQAHLRFYVKDTGIGIPTDRQEAIFERFIQADIEDKMAYQGAGLGLPISKAYVEMLGGKIWVESEQDKGSTFYFTLPYNTDPVKETIDRQLTPSESPNKEC